MSARDWMMERKGTADVRPRDRYMRTGEKNTPRKLPNAEFKMEAASLPPIAFVRMTAELTGGGKQLTT